MSIDPRRIEVVDDRVAEILRRKTPGERLAMSSALWRFGRSIVEAGVRRSHPDWSADQVRREVVRRMTSGSR